MSQSSQPNNDETVSNIKKKKPLNVFAQFVKDNYSTIQQENGQEEKLSHSQIMKLLSQKYKSIKHQQQPGQNQEEVREK